jgi:hypothetical protein
MVSLCDGCVSGKTFSRGGYVFDETQNQQGGDVERGAQRGDPSSDPTRSREAALGEGRDGQQRDHQAESSSARRFGAADDLEQSLEARRHEEYGEVQ